MILSYRVDRGVLKLVRASSMDVDTEDDNCVILNLRINGRRIERKVKLSAEEWDVLKSALGKPSEVRTEGAL